MLLEQKRKGRGWRGGQDGNWEGRGDKMGGWGGGGGKVSSDLQ